MKAKIIFFDLGETLIMKNRQWVPGAQTTLITLREKGLRLGIISNTGNLSRAQLIDVLPADFEFQMFDKNLIILSFEVGIEKPSAEIFQLAVKKAKVKAKQCLYCSENSAETLAAEKAGLKVINILPPPNSNIGKLSEILT